MIKKLIIALAFVVVSLQVALAQKNIFWITYGHSKFIESPGLEYQRNVYKSIGLQIGTSAYIQYPDNTRVVNIKERYPVNFYAANIGLTGLLYEKYNLAFGVTTGLKMYYGPYFKLLTYYDVGGYDIYFNASQNRPIWGFDTGLYFRYKKWSALLKYDTARYQFRFGGGYVF